MTYDHILPPEPGPHGRPPLEFSLMKRAEALVRAVSGGDGDDLFTVGETASVLSCDPNWFRHLVIDEGRGPQPTPVGRSTVFKRRHIVDWLRFLAREAKARRKASKRVPA